MLKKVLAITLFSVMLISITGCNDKKNEVKPADESRVTEDAKKSEVNENVEDAVPTEEPPIVSDNVEKDFSGVWRMVSTSSENKNFETMILDISYTGYSVSMTFLKEEINASYEGKYKIKDGVLVFDDNFADCTAYFYEGSDDTLVVDNGISQVFCKKVPEN